MEITVMVIITVVQHVTALGRDIGVLLQMISYQLVIGRVKIYGLRVVVEKVAQKDENAKVYLADHAPLLVNHVPVVSLLVSLLVSRVPIVVSPFVSLESLVVILLENNYI